VTNGTYIMFIEAVGYTIEGKRGGRSIGILLAFNRLTIGVLLVYYWYNGILRSIG
jgi:hypothetical protein